MRARNLKPGFFKNEMLASCHPLARILFAGLWCLADRVGILENRPARIKAELLPYDKCNIEELIEQLKDKGFIGTYSYGDAEFIYIPTFPQHQRPHPHEQPAGYPLPPELEKKLQVITSNDGDVTSNVTGPSGSSESKPSGSSGSSGSSKGEPGKPESEAQSSTKTPLPPTPPELDTPEFRSAWGEWLCYRRDRRLSTRPQTLQKQLAFLAALGSAGAVMSIEASIRNGWQGLFEPRGPSYRRAASNGPSTGSFEAFINGGKKP